MGVLNVIDEEAKKDFFYFIRHILLPIAPKAFSMSEARHFHQMYNLINSDFNSFNLYQFGTYKPASNNDLHNKKLCLVPRMHGKTRQFTEAYSMWLLYKNPDLRILIISQTWNNSRKMLLVIKQYYERIRQNAKDVNSPNRIPGLILGNWIGDVWNEDNVYVRPRVNPDKTPSIATAGLGTEITSQHYDVVIGDDLIGEENSQTIDQLDKAKAEFGSLMEVGDYERDKQTLFLLLGTRWHPQDLYKMIMDDLGRFYDTLVLRCWDNEENKTPLFPEKFTSQMLEAIRAEKLMSPHPMQWYLQWMNDSTPVSRSPFQEQYFKYYTADTKPKDMRVWLLIDPGKSVV